MASYTTVVNESHGNPPSQGFEVENAIFSPHAMPSLVAAEQQVLTRSEASGYSFVNRTAQSLLRLMLCLFWLLFVRFCLG
jgi:hypothetical protein